jgi:hypothetical protein
MVDEPGSTVPFFGILYRVLQILGMMGLFIYFQNDLKGHKTIAQCFTSKKQHIPLASTGLDTVIFPFMFMSET